MVGHLGGLLHVNGGGHGGGDVPAAAEVAVVAQQHRQPIRPQGHGHIVRQLLGAGHREGNHPHGGELRLGRGGGGQLVQTHGHDGGVEGVGMHRGPHIGPGPVHRRVHGGLGGGPVGPVDPLPGQGDDGDVLRLHGVVGPAAGGDGHHIPAGLPHGDVPRGAVDQPPRLGLPDGAQHLPADLLILHMHTSSFVQD